MLDVKLLAVTAQLRRRDQLTCLIIFNNKPPVTEKGKRQISFWRNLLNISKMLTSLIHADLASLFYHLIKIGTYVLFLLYQTFVRMERGGYLS